MPKKTAPAAPLKDLLGLLAVTAIADAGAAVSSRFDRQGFLAAAVDALEGLSIMERVRHIAASLEMALPSDYSESLNIVLAMAPRLKHGFQGVALAELVARRGLGDFERSLEALADLTRHGSAEFAIRPFLAKDPPRTLAVMTRWTQSEDEHVRRLASEGSRPRLPWAPRVPALKDDPTLASDILEKLRADPSLYVRKSVANHLNDIAKDRPDWLVDRLDSWPKDDPRTVWIIRHGLRTLIKKGDPRALKLVGASDHAEVEILRFSVTPSSISLGDTIRIEAELASRSSKTQRLVVDYRIRYVRAGDKISEKTFKLKTIELGAGNTAAVGIGQTIRDFSTRRHYPGHHEVTLIVNGRTLARGGFDLS